MRKFLYSRWFFGFLALVLGFDFLADLYQIFTPHSALLDCISSAVDAVGISMVLWMFIDLTKRRPRRGGHTPS